MKKAIVPGTFDPITNGHLDIIERAAKLADNVVVAVAPSAKKNPLFSVEEREKMAREACSHLTNVEVSHFEGMLVDFAHSVGADAFVKGLRVVTDFEYEAQMAILNYKFDKNIETVFVMSPPNYMHLSSTQVREVAEFGGDYQQFVPKIVAEMLSKKFS